METPNERKARLKALRAAAREEEEEEAAGAPAEAEDAEAPQEAGALTEAQRPDVPRLKFRNYAVRDKKNIEHDAIEAAHPPEQPAAPAPEPVADDADKDPLSLAAPRKANWDLRRDVAKKLEKLDRRTQRALLLIMQQEHEAQAAGEAIEAG